MGFVVTEDKGKYQIIEDGFFRWKREGTVLTMLGFLQPWAVCDYDKLYANMKYQNYVKSMLPTLKKRGIDTIELWVFKEGLEKTKESLEKGLKVKFEVVREEETMFLCRLLL